MVWVLVICRMVSVLEACKMAWEMEACKMALVVAGHRKAWVAYMRVWSCRQT